MASKIIQLGQRAFVAHELESFAFLCQRLNRPEQAAHLLTAAETLQEAIGTSAFGVERLKDEYKRTVFWLHTQFDETFFQAHWNEGQEINMEEAINYALAE